MTSRLNTMATGAFGHQACANLACCHLDTIPGLRPLAPSLFEYRFESPRRLSHIRAKRGWKYCRSAAWKLDLWCRSHWQGMLAIRQPHHVPNRA
jgi:hypothetical protein